MGQNCRLTWDRHTWKLEELPVKGKKKCKVADLHNPASHNVRGLDAYIDGNILRDARLSASDSYEIIKQKMLDAFEMAAETTLAKASPEDVKHFQWLRDSKWYENEVHYLKITPEDTEPFNIEGKDFTLKVSWTDFSVYSPQSDFQQTQPFYMGYKASSSTAARKLYQILKAEPGALKSMPYAKLDEWFAKNKIQTRSDNSVWT